MSLGFNVAENLKFVFIGRTQVRVGGFDNV